MSAENPLTPKQQLTIEKSAPGRRAARFDRAQKPASAYLPASCLRKSAPRLPELSEFDVVRHYSNLARLNFSLDTHFYPLGSCTMKYNPKCNEEAASMPGFASAHPQAPDSAVQGTLRFLYELESMLCALTGLDAFTLQPAAGAHGEFVGIMLARAYHLSRGDKGRTEIVVPDSAHGTNPASASMGGFSVVTVKSGADGRVHPEELRKYVGPKTAMVMLTIPNTAGLFEKDIEKISAIVHEAGALLYMDGANFNALIGLVRPADLGVDLMHLNLHKTFSTPHGGGGPGSGPVGVRKHLIPFLPSPRVALKDGKYSLEDAGPQSIGRVKSFAANTGVALKAFCYLLQHSAQSLREISESAIISANYLRVKLKAMFPSHFDTYCMHECVLSTVPEKLGGVKTMDVAKRLLDKGFYAPTVYFPLIVPEALMIEPTETESKAALDSFVQAMTEIYQEAQKDPELLKSAPHNLPVRRLDEVGAARTPNLRWN
ncbi:MAG: aminomethyl-transferring glycine dehydrogenase subunit GcvPB [Elusimicrobia bacterium]|nr:aminomethyl-transferring glycine dehydrogenase subunit GcvPB [Elusimicrobiota bacterium]